MPALFHTQGMEYCSIPEPVRMQPDMPTHAVRRRRFFLRSCPGPTPHQRPVFFVESVLTDWLLPRNVEGRVRGTNIWWDPVCTVAVGFNELLFQWPWHVHDLHIIRFVFLSNTWVQYFIIYNLRFCSKIHLRFCSKIHLPPTENGYIFVIWIFLSFEDNDGTQYIEIN
jgi:hypothetical protein